MQDTPAQQTPGLMCCTEGVNGHVSMYVGDIWAQQGSYASKEKEGFGWVRGLRCKPQFTSTAPAYWADTC